FVADNLVLESGQTRRVDVQLEVGESTTEVVVNASAAVIDTEGGQLSASFDETRFQSAPMFGVIRNNPAPVLLTLPGVGIGHGGSNNLNFGGIASGNNIQLGMDGAATDGPVNQIHQMEDVEEVV